MKTFLSLKFRKGELRNNNIYSVNYKRMLLLLFIYKRGATAGDRTPDTKTFDIAQVNNDFCTRLNYLNLMSRYTAIMQLLSSVYSLKLTIYF